MIKSVICRATGGLVHTMTQQDEENVKRQFIPEEQCNQAFQLIQAVCKQKHVSVSLSAFAENHGLARGRMRIKLRRDVTPKHGRITAA